MLLVRTQGFSKPTSLLVYSLYMLHYFLTNLVRLCQCIVLTIIRCICMPHYFLTKPARLYQCNVLAILQSETSIPGTFPVRLLSCCLLNNSIDRNTGGPWCGAGEILAPSCTMEYDERECAGGSSRVYQGECLEGSTVNACDVCLCVYPVKRGGFVIAWCCFFARLTFRTTNMTNLARLSSLHHSRMQNQDHATRRENPRTPFLRSMAPHAHCSPIPLH